MPNTHLVGERAAPRSNELGEAKAGLASRVNRAARHADLEGERLASRVNRTTRHEPNKPNNPMTHETTEQPQRKHPAHMPPIERHNAPVVLFVTLAIKPRGPFLTNARFLDAFTKACADADAWTVGHYLIMPDHVHLFCRPAAVPHIGIKRWASYLKRRVTAHLGDHTWTWQTDCWDTQMRDQPHYIAKRAYVHQNPARADLMQEPEEWPWQGELSVIQW
ncbi:MAG: hypothetical protein JXR37_28990 [Kiritimatiellae bacterium]|nr:hypothetical protein [Kiritimatiellia bacterium]